MTIFIGFIWFIAIICCAAIVLWLIGSFITVNNEYEANEYLAKKGRENK